jgi:hypothetical protein
LLGAVAMMLQLVVMMTTTTMVMMLMLAALVAARGMFHRLCLPSHQQTAAVHLKKVNHLPWHLQSVPLG